MTLPTAPVLASVAFAALGVWCALQACLYLAYFADLAASSDYHLVSSILAPFGVYVVASIVLLRFRDRLAQALFGTTADDATQTAVEPVQSFLLGLLGLWLIVDSLALGIAAEAHRISTARAISELYPPPDLGHLLLSGEAWADRLQYLVRFVAGIVFFFFSGNVVRAWQAARKAGRPGANELAA